MLKRLSKVKSSIDEHQIELTEENLRKKIVAYNTSEGQMMTVDHDDTGAFIFKGFLRVHLAIEQQVSVSIAAPNMVKRNSKANLFDNTLSGGGSGGIEPAMGGLNIEGQQQERFYLPVAVDKVIAIDSKKNTDDVVKMLLSKFRIRDDPSQFSLHLVGKDGVERLIHPEENPLLIRLLLKDTSVKFSLKDSFLSTLIYKEQWDNVPHDDLVKYNEKVAEEEKQQLLEIAERYRVLRANISKEIHDRLLELV